MPNTHHVTEHTKAPLQPMGHPTATPNGTDTDLYFNLSLPHY